MKKIKVFLSLTMIAILCFAGYKFVEYKQATDTNTENVVKGDNEKGEHLINEGDGQNVTGKNDDMVSPDGKDNEVGTSTPNKEQPLEQIDEPLEPNPNENHEPNSDSTQGESKPVFASNVEHVAVLINAAFMIPEDYVPTDLVYPDVRFTFDEKIEKRMLREVAARALEQMFAAAEVDGIYLAGVSAYRSHETQTKLFNYYVERDGLEKAKTFSAEPGTSEHETGLAIDISGSTGKCAAQDCFADTAEAVWLAANGAKFGFIVRYPEGKEHITGYKYEPWHMRYVGKDVAEKIVSENITLEEYYER